MASVNVVKNFYKKNAEGFSSPYYIGTEQYYVSPIRGSNIHNLEEQLLIGTNCISASWKERNGTLRTTKEFRGDDVTQDYYVLESYDYTNTTNVNDYIDYVSGVLSFRVQESNLELNGSRAILINDELYETDEDGDIIVNATPVTPSGDEVIVRKEELFFQNNDNRIPVSEKVTTKFYNNIGKLVEKQVITNKL